MSKVKIKNDFTNKTLKVSTKQAEINLTVDKYDEKIKVLQKDIDLLKSRQWKYKVGEIALYNKDLRKVEITKLLDNNKDYLYEGHIAYTEDSYTSLFKQDDLSKYLPWDYERLPIDRIWELNAELNKYKTMMNIML